VSLHRHTAGRAEEELRRLVDRYAEGPGTGDIVDAAALLVD
jgi:hypothetical protein